jgi:hypothetical protein
MPGISAVSASDANSWVGKRASYRQNGAAFDTTRCDTPAYDTRSVPADSFFNAGFQIRPADLGFTSGQGARVKVTEITCHGQPWTAPGALIMWIDSTRAYTVWNGVFLKLHR